MKYGSLPAWRSASSKRAGPLPSSSSALLIVCSKETLAAQSMTMSMSPGRSSPSSPRSPLTALTALSSRSSKRGGGEDLVLEAIVGVAAQQHRDRRLRAAHGRSAPARPCRRSPRRRSAVAGFRPAARAMSRPGTGGSTLLTCQSIASTDRILEAARGESAQHGYAARLPDIAERAGPRTRLLLYHFKSKARLYAGGDRAGDARLGGDDIAGVSAAPVGFGGSLGWWRRASSSSPPTTTSWSSRARGDRGRRAR